MSKFICKCCGKPARWCGDGPPNPEDDSLGLHNCDHIHCDNCGMHYSLESKEASEIETLEELKKMMEYAYNNNNGLGELTEDEIDLIREKRKLRKKCGDYWLTPEGRKEIRECWDNPNDGNIVLPLLNELERLENGIKKISIYLKKLEDIENKIESLGRNEMG